MVKRSSRGKGSKRKSTKGRRSKNKVARRVSRSESRAISAAKARTKKNPCGPGRILRKGYTRRGYSRMSRSGKRVSVGRASVKARCIKDVGKKGYGPKLIPPLTPGLLRQFGYDTHSSAANRHKALDKAVKSLGESEVYKHLRAIVTLQRWNPPTHDKMLSDFEYMRGKYYPHQLNKYTPVGY